MADGQSPTRPEVQPLHAVRQSPTRRSPIRGGGASSHGVPIRGSVGRETRVIEELGKREKKNRKEEKKDPEGKKHKKEKKKDPEGKKH